MLLDGRPDLVARAGADGAHLTGIEAFQAAVPALKPDRIAGCGGIHSRHDAMLAAETRGRLPDVRRARRRRPTAVVRRDPRACHLVGGSVRDPLRRLCRRRSTKSGRWRRPAPILSRSAIGSSRMPVASRLPSAMRWRGSRSRRRSDEHASCAPVAGALVAGLTARCDHRRAGAGARSAQPGAGAARTQGSAEAGRAQAGAGAGTPPAQANVPATPRSGARRGLSARFSAATI